MNEENNFDNEPGINDLNKPVSNGNEGGIPIIDNTKAEINIDSAEKVIEERSKNLFRFFKKSNLWVFGVLIILIILGAYIRSMPMHDHGGNPGLWDIATNSWTLGPDLDPWLFTRYAKIIVEEGELPNIDTMRNVPLGYNTLAETRLLPYMIAYTHYFFNVFGDYPIEFSAAIFPVIMFIFTILAFFLFVREIFVRKTKKSAIRANIISLISTFFMILMPAFLSRTIAGIPEKESAGFFFLFLSFYLFLKAWKSEKPKDIIIFSILSGISTAAMGLIWGGFIYIFITISLANFLAFILGKIRKKEIIIYSLWIIFSMLFLTFFSERFTLSGLIISSQFAIASIVFFIFVVHFILWHTKLKKIKYLQKSKIPENLLTLIITIILGLIAITIFFGPGFILDKIEEINTILFKPIAGRWGQTVAENRQPYFTEWSQNFGPFIKTIPILFWLFFVGSVVLFKNMLNKIKEKDSWILTGTYVLFFFGLVFSRYSPSSTFNGENFISKLFYFCTSLLLIGMFIYYYIKYKKLGDESFRKINFSYLLLFSLFILCLFTARSAVRLIMVLAPVAVIFVGYLIVNMIEAFRKVNDETMKIIFGSLMVLIILLSFFVIFGNQITNQPGYYQTIKGQAYNFVPSSYNQQWQKAMKWVREETPKEAVFSHWWDYGYWLQSIGERATVLDGGNAISYWNYLMGRLVLTGDNQDDALEFLYNHNSTHLLIDSSDIGKYGAFSSIGSDKDFDRYSWMSPFLLDESQTQETKNQTLLIYPGGLSLDEDLIINQDGKEILFPAGSAGIGAVIVPSEKREENMIDFMQPYVIIVYQGNQHQVDLRYLYVDGKMIDFETGIEATAYVFPTIIPQGQGISQNPIGAVLYLSPRLMRGLLAQVYILNDPFNNFPNFKPVYSEQSLIVDSLNNQGMNLPEFIFYQGIQGPIKIWEIEYTGEEEIKQEYLDTDATKYLDWNL